MSSAFSLVVFDVGSVLVEAGRTLADDIAIAGFSVEPEWLAQFEERLRDLPRPYLGAIRIADYASHFAQLSEGRFSAEDALRIATDGFVRECAGIATVFDAFDAAGIEQALLSNVHDGEWAKLFPDDGSVSAFPNVGRVMHRFASHLIGARKPDARIYAHLEREMRRAGHEIIFFDDREENVEAARDRGWTAELIDHRADTAAQLLQWLRRYEVIA